MSLDITYFRDGSDYCLVVEGQDTYRGTEPQMLERLRTLRLQKGIVSLHTLVNIEDDVAKRARLALVAALQQRDLERRVTTQ